MSFMEMVSLIRNVIHGDAKFQRGEGERIRKIVKERDCDNSSVIDIRQTINHNISMLKPILQPPSDTLCQATTQQQL